MVFSENLADTPPLRFRLDADRTAPAAQRRRLAQDLRQALAQDQLQLHYQPRISLHDGACLGAEALTRWPRSRSGMVPPDIFIAAAERSDLIIDIGSWCLNRACTEAAGWQPPDGMDDAPMNRSVPMIVSVNVSARQLRDDVLLEQVAMALDISGLSPEQLELELTESMVIDGDLDTLLMLSAIRDLGVGLSLDDFGTGHASLSILKRLPLTAMKLDRSLTRELPDSHEDTAIARAAVQTGHALGLSVVAEGIETEAQRSLLAAIGCDEGQGYLFSPAIDPASLRRNFIASH